MTYGSLHESVELYRSDDLSLQRAAARGGVSTRRLVSELRTRGVELREQDQTGVTSTRY